MQNLDELERRLEAAKTPEELSAIQAELDGAASSRWEVETLAEVAALLGLQTQSVREFRTLPDPMPGTEGHWNMIDIFRWRCERLAARNVGSQNAERVGLENRILSAKASKIELESMENRGELVHRDAVKATLSGILNFVRCQLEAIPSAIGPSIPPDIRSELTHQISQQIALILRKMSQMRSEMRVEVETVAT